MSDPRNNNPDNLAGANQKDSDKKHKDMMVHYTVELFVGVLFLIVVPGLVLGIMMKEVPTGIALSGTLATVANFVAGFYYYHNK